jgi:hypothetical protein
MGFLFLCPYEQLYEEQNIHTESAYGRLMLTILASYAQ